MSFVEQESIVIVLANLIVRSDKRKLGVAKMLMKEAERVCKNWGFDELYLLVNQNNNRARKLYKTAGILTLIINLLY